VDPERRHDARAVALTHLAAILVKGHIAHPVERVFDSPVTSYKSEDLLGCLRVGSHVARDSVHPLMLRLSTIEIGYVAVEPECHSDVGKGKIAREVVADLDLARFDSTMRLIKRFCLRGKNPRRAQS